jgi:hypothetical protein
MLFQRPPLNFAQWFPVGKLLSLSAIALLVESFLQMRFRAPFETAEADPFGFRLHDAGPGLLVVVAVFRELVEPTSVGVAKEHRRTVRECGFDCHVVIRLAEHSRQGRALPSLRSGVL